MKIDRGIWGKSVTIKLGKYCHLLNFVAVIEFQEYSAALAQNTLLFTRSRSNERSVTLNIQQMEMPDFTSSRCQWTALYSRPETTLLERDRTSERPLVATIVQFFLWTRTIHHLKRHSIPYDGSVTLTGSWASWVQSTNILVSTSHFNFV
jgi:hypothetical protein